MANKKQKKVENKPKQLSKQEKEMFSVKTCAHDREGNPVNWDLLKSLCGY